jgi:uncharacterized membrane-anchored protein YitT (DUF2179 family)
MKRVSNKLSAMLKILAGCVVFNLGFNLFLLPCRLNAGGLSGVAMVLVSWLESGTVGSVTLLLNLPLFALAGVKIGRRFILLSLWGTFLSALLMDLFSYLPAVSVDPALSALYGGGLCGLGVGIVFSAGGSTGGSDIVIRLLKQRWRGIPIGTLAIVFDLSVACVTGIAFGEPSGALYSGLAIFVSGRVVDAVVYRFDYSRVAWVITKKHIEIAGAIACKLGRGATFLYGEGSFRRQDTCVVLTAVRRQQLPGLKELVAGIDPEAFVIVQEAHQVMGDGFLRYSGDEL